MPVSPTLVSKRRESSERPVTLRDIARECSVSRTAVSHALKNRGRLTAKTRQHILGTAASMGYRPDPGISRLMAHLRMRRQRQALETIAFLNTYPERNPWHRNVHLRTLRDAIHQRAHTLGFSSEDFWQHEAGMTPARMTSILRSRGIAGVVLLGFPEVVTSFDLGWEHFACCTIGHSLAVPIHRVCANQYRELQVAYAELTRRGYHRIGLIANPSVSARVEHYYTAAFLVAQESRPTRARLRPLISEGDARSFTRWFRRERPDAILLAQAPPSPAQVVEWMHLSGRKDTDRVGLALLDVGNDADQISGIRQARTQSAATAIDVVSGQLMRGELGLPQSPQVIKIEGTWYAGKTTPGPDQRRGVLS